MYGRAFYDEAAVPAGGGTKLYRLKRAAADAEGGGRCLKEARDKATGKKPADPAFCLAFCSEVAPTFQVLLESKDLSAVVLESIDVDVKHVSTRQGAPGFFTDQADYDLAVKAVVGQTSIQLRHPLKCTKTGTVNLRMGFNASAQPVAIDFTLRFHVQDSSGNSTVTSGGNSYRVVRRFP